MTLKQRRLVNNTIKAIMANKPFTQKEIAIKSGFSPKSGNEYRANIKKHIIERLKKLGYSEDDMRERFNLASELTLAKQDFTNYLRSNEDIARMQSMFNDKQIIDATVITKEENNLLNKYMPNRLSSILSSENVNSIVGDNHNTIDNDNPINHNTINDTNTDNIKDTINTNTVNNKDTHIDNNKTDI